MRLISAMNIMYKLPTLFLAHGGGPFPVLGDANHTGLSAALRNVQQFVPSKPSAILVISAHWEESVPTVTSGQHPPLIYDYHGFPPESYSLQYPAPGDPALAARVASLLRSSGMSCNEDSTRGFDHGTFIPLMLAYPDADIPVVQLSLISSLDPEQHIAMGAALEPLREEGVLIFASGMSFHNMRVFMQAMGGGGGASVSADPKSIEFDAYLNRAVVDSSSTISWEERREMLVNWKRAPHALFCHPREEHLLPLMVAFGAAGEEAGKVMYSAPLLGAQVSSFAFGYGDQGVVVGVPSDEL